MFVNFVNKFIYFRNDLQSFHITVTVSSMHVNNLRYIFLLDVDLNYASLFLTSHNPEWRCGTLKGVGPAESTFLWDSKQSLLSAQTLPNSQAHRKTDI